MPLCSRQMPRSARPIWRVARNAAVLASALALGCASPQQREVTTTAALEGAGKGALGGVFVGAEAGLRLSFYCGPYVVACAPVFLAYGSAAGLVAGAVGGAVVGAVKAPQVSPSVTADQRPSQESVPAQATAPAQETAPVRSLAGLTLIPASTASGQMPAGYLYVSARSVRQADGTDRFAVVTIDLEQPTARGEKSYLAETLVHCDRGALTLNWWSTFSEPGSAGLAINSHAMSPPIVVDKPSVPLEAVIRAICQHPL